MSRKAGFKVGDSVFYPSAGVGKIESIEDIFIAGDFGECYVIHFDDTRAVIRVPRSNLKSTGIRPLVSSRKIRELYRVLAARCSRRVTGGNWTERCKELERKINTGSCIQLGEVVRDLMHWKKKTGLSFEESMLLETASSYLSNELATVQGIEQEKALSKIHSCVSA